MTELVKWVDYVVIGTGSSRRQIAAMADAIDDAFQSLGDKKVGGAGYNEGGWMVLDYGDVLVHLFDEEKRDYYQLEHLWGDAPRVEWRLDESSRGNHETRGALGPLDPPSAP